VASQKQGKAEYAQGIRNAIAFFNDLKAGALARVMSKAAESATGQIQALVKAKYRSYGRSSGFGYKAARAGKEKGRGNRPYRLPMPESHVGLQGFARFVVVTPQPGKGYVVQIDPLAVHISTGKNLAQIAHGIENPPGEAMVKITLRSIVYQIMIREGRGGYGTRKSARNYLPEEDKDRGFYYYTPPKRPVWSAVAKDIVRRILPKVADEQVKKRLERMAQAYGAA